MMLNQLAGRAGRQKLCRDEIYLKMRNYGADQQAPARRTKCSHCGNRDDHSGRKSEWSEEENLIASNDLY